MDALKFTLSGKTAFFKKPDVNTFYYFTYGNIHKIALLGILGAINGYKGYNQQEVEGTTYPEFYEKLKDIKIGIVPINDKGYISKKVQVFNNSIGYYNKDKDLKPCNLVINEQWLEDPKWDIYILINGEVEEELADRIINFRATYIPYLGKNDHMADIKNVELIKDIEKIDSANKIHSLFFKNSFNLVVFEDDFNIEKEYVPPFKYEEMLPLALEENTNKYELETFIYTNSELENIKDSIVYKCNEKIIFFF